MRFTHDELVDMGFAYVGRNVTVFKGAVLVNPKNIELGDGCQIDDFVHIIASQRVRIGRRAHVACFSSLAGGGEITLGDFVGVSAGSRLLSGTDDFLGGGLTGPTIPAEFRSVTRSFVRVGKHAILGTNTIVHPGVEIGEGVATGSATLVTKSLADWGVYTGIPARRVKDRPRETVLRLAAQLVASEGY